MLHVALLRGINLAGKNRLAMKDLAAMFTAAGCNDVRTYIQSGNVIFDAPAAHVKKLPEILSREIVERFGHRVPVILRTAPEIARVIESNPFLLAGQPEKTLHVYFLADLPTTDAISTLDFDRSPPDRFAVCGREVYVQLPGGMARTKLTNAYFDSKLSTTSTARNWATVLQIHKMMRG